MVYKKKQLEELLFKLPCELCICCQSPCDGVSTIWRHPISFCYRSCSARVTSHFPHTTFWTCLTRFSNNANWFSHVLHVFGFFPYLERRVEKLTRSGNLISEDLNVTLKCKNKIYLNLKVKLISYGNLTFFFFLFMLKK